jgi:hypothetical protein
VTVFTPLTLKLGDQPETVVWNLTQLADALKQSWPNKRSSSYRKTARLVTGAIHGHCTSGAANIAFAVARGEPVFSIAQTLTARTPV